MQIIKDSNNVVVYAGGPFTLTETGMYGLGFYAPNINLEKYSLETIQALPDDWEGGWYVYDGEWVLTQFGSDQKAANEAQDLFDSIVFDTLSSDTWTIPADGITHATVTYTAQETVYFSVNETVHAVEPIDYIATLEITADAPGPIRVEVKDKQLIITAIEVSL